MKLPVYDERHGAFAKLRNRRVLIYWPHGLGDFVHLSYVLPLLEPSNTYYITRFGDDYSHLYDTSDIATPLSTTITRPRDRGNSGPPHLGIDFKRIRNAEMDAVFPEPLQSSVKNAQIDAVLYTDYPEREGRLAFPFHTKARALAKDLVAFDRLATLPLHDKLQSALPFAVSPETAVLVEERVRTYVGSGERFTVVASGGHTFPEKTLPEAQVAALAYAIQSRDPKSRVITVDERTSTEIGRDPNLAATTQDIFGDLPIPFSEKLTALLRVSDAFIGVVSGPLHMALAIGGRPTVGIWLAHHPDWYDEPNQESIHLLGPIAVQRNLARRKATTSLPQNMRARTVDFPDRTPGAIDIVNLLDMLR